MRSPTFAKGENGANLPSQTKKSDTLLAAGSNPQVLLADVCGRGSDQYFVANNYRGGISLMFWDKSFIFGMGGSSATYYWVLTMNLDGSEKNTIIIPNQGAFHAKDARWAWYGGGKGVGVQSDGQMAVFEFQGNVFLQSHTLGAGEYPF